MRQTIAADDPFLDPVHQSDLPGVADAGSWSQGRAFEQEVIDNFHVVTAICCEARGALIPPTRVATGGLRMMAHRHGVSPDVAA